MSSVKTRAQKIQEEEALKKKNLPNWWRNSIYFCVSWTSGWAWLNLSGVWQSQVTKCTVAVTWWDETVSDSVAITGLMSVFLIFAAFEYLKNR